MLTARINECKNCNTLKEILKQVECSMQNFSRNKLINENYNVESYYCSDTMQSLMHYKRFLTRKIYNPSYLCSIDNQDLIYQAKKLIFGKCLPCIPCEEEIVISTTTLTSSTTLTTSTTSTTII